MIILLIRLIVSIALAILVGKIVSKTKLPSILGWLLAGMLLGPHAFGLINNELLNSDWYKTIINILECTVGLLIGTELIWNRIKKTGKQIIITTLTQSLGTYFVVSIIFSVAFYFTGVPLYLSVIFGGIALATAPAPALSIVREFKTDGPVTKTLIPMAALDDVVAVIVFFTTISVVSNHISEQKLPLYMILVVILLPIIIGVILGFIVGLFFKKEYPSYNSNLILISTLLIASSIGFFFNNFVLPKPVLNFYANWYGLFSYFR